METRPLGSSGLKASVVGLGCNNFGMRIQLEETRVVIDAALDAGVNFFDTADLYGFGVSEDMIGQILGSRRKDVVLATKFGGIAKVKKTGEKWGSRAYIMDCVEASLKRLQTDWIDVYQMHYPDKTTAIDETLETLDELVRQGKIRAIGHSNFTGAMIYESEDKATAGKFARFDTAQNEWSLLKREAEDDAVPACDKHQLGQLPYFPLANGLLTGKYKRGEAFAPDTRLGALEMFQGWATDDNFSKVEALQTFVEERGHTLLELAFSWLAAQPCVASVIAGATKPEQVHANAAAADWKLSAEELTEIDALVPRG
jgi:aryl-alcohol dehydrogenase-like predicted oxidoreductase